MYEPNLHLQLDFWSEFCDSDTLFTKNRALVYMRARFLFFSHDPELKVEVWLKDLHWRQAVWEALGGFGEAWGGFGSFWAIFGRPSDTLSQK